MKTTVVTQFSKKPSPNVAKTQHIELVEATDTYQEPLILCTYGPPGAGKSRIIGTAPGAIGLIPTERKSRQTVLATAALFGRRVITPDQDLIRTANPMLIGNMPQTCIVIGDKNHANWKPGEIQDEMQRIAKTITLDSQQPECCQRHYFRWHVNRVKSVAFRMAEMPEIKTIAMDTFGAFVDDVSYANYGITGVIDPKEFGFAPREDMNKEIRDFLNTISHKHLILTHHSSDVWRDGKPTKKTKPMSAFGKIGHYVSVMTEQVRDEEKEEGEGRYTLRVKDCQANAGIIGLDLLYDDGITFAALASLVYPDSDPANWE